MAKKKVNTIRWMPDVEDHDYPAARSYLSLIYSKKRVDKLIARFRSARIAEFKAKDIFRASGLSLLGVSNWHVEKDRRRIMAGKPLCPLLLVRTSEIGRVIVADGYHRMCAVYDFDEDAIIHCKII